ncbi:MAG TPA: hypothetical protein VFK78_08260 [Gemmatimonadales bacterium]|nr:hypothetical protein [Gemmatimonadales bacterium]
MVPGLTIGGICADCTRVLTRRAGRIARWIALGTTLPLAAYLVLTLPPDRTARTIGAAAAVVWYALVYQIASRVALEVLK